MGKKVEEKSLEFGIKNVPPDSELSRASTGRDSVPITIVDGQKQEIGILVCIDSFADSKFDGHFFGSRAIGDHACELYGDKNRWIYETWGNFHAVFDPNTRAGSIRITNFRKRGVGILPREF